MQRVPGLTLEPKEEIASNEDQCQYTLSHAHTRYAMRWMHTATTVDNPSKKQIICILQELLNEMQFIFNEQEKKKRNEMQTCTNWNDEKFEAAVLSHYLHTFMIAVGNLFVLFSNVCFWQTQNYAVFFRHIGTTENGHHLWSAFVCSCFHFNQQICCTKIADWRLFSCEILFVFLSIIFRNETKIESTELVTCFCREFHWLTRQTIARIDDFRLHSNSDSSRTYKLSAN